MLRCNLFLPPQPQKPSSKCLQKCERAIFQPLFPLGLCVYPLCLEYSGTFKPRDYPHTKWLTELVYRNNFLASWKPCVCPLPWLLPDLLKLPTRAARPQPSPTCQPQGCYAAWNNFILTTHNTKGFSLIWGQVLRAWVYCMCQDKISLRVNQSYLLLLPEL